MPMMFSAFAAGIYSKRLSKKARLSLKKKKTKELIPTITRQDKAKQKADRIRELKEKGLFNLF